MSSAPRIGIDLGTTNSLVAVFEEGGPRLIRNAQGETLTPSVVGILPSGEVVVGSAARGLAITQPDRVASCFKRWMGTDRSIELTGVDGSKGASTQTFTAPELSSLVLQSLIADAEADLGTQITSAVITVPAYFNQHQRAATRQAAELAGLKVDRIVNEPTAAALVYGFHERNADQKLVVFDLGGGTFDVTVMEIFEGTLEILGTAGESRLGGEDFTDTIVSKVLRASGRNLEHAELYEPLLVSRVRAEAELAKRGLADHSKRELTDHSKRELTGRDELVVRVPEPDGTLLPDGERVTVSAAEFEELVEPLLERLRRPTLRALRDASLLAGAIDEVILVGGATRMPVIRRLAREMFDRAPMDGVHPDEAVALGSAIQSALVADDAAVDDLVMTDVCPHTLGAEISREIAGRHMTGYFLPVIHRNTTVPVSREESVCTLQANQRTVTVTVYQGESRRVEENTKLGELLVDGLPPGPAGLEVILRFTYDLNGLLEVEAIVPSTGERSTLLLQQNSSQMSEAELEAAQKKMRALKVYPRESLGNQRLLSFAAAAIKEVAPVFREDLEEAIVHYEAWLAQNDGERFEQARDALLMTLSTVGLPYEEGPNDSGSNGPDGGRGGPPR